MKNSVPVFLFFLTISTIVPAQQAQDYFPAQGYNWIYKVFPLDSASNADLSDFYFRVDSFAVTADYLGMNAAYIFSKSGSGEEINFLPYDDTLFYHIEGTEAYEYFTIALGEDILHLMDSLFPAVNFSALFERFKNWYSFYRFNSNVNEVYTIFSRDTTLDLNGTLYPLRFETLGKRLNDETLQTDLGAFDCKKFLDSNVVSYVLGNIIKIPILKTVDTVWIAPGNWIVKEFRPSTVVDLSFLGMESYNVYGSETEITSSVTGVDEENSPLIKAFFLDQNYPNPFNPATTISWYMPAAAHVTLKIYDLLGNEVKTLVEEVKPAGRHHVVFNAGGLSSGTYFYTISTGKESSAKKLILIK